jgi:lipoate-protein ligase A
VLQHGSLPLHGDLARIVDYLALSDDERAKLRPYVRARALTVKEAKRRDAISFDDAAQAMAQGVAGTLNLTLEPGTLSEQERRWAADLRHRYAATDWTART